MPDPELLPPPPKKSQGELLPPPPKKKVIGDGTIEQSGGENPFSPLSSLGVTDNIVKISGRDVKVKEVPIPLAQDANYIQQLQERINTKTFNQDDVAVVSKAMNVSPVAADAYLSGKRNTGDVIAFVDAKNKNGQFLAETIQKANNELGTQYDFEKVFATP